MRPTNSALLAALLCSTATITYAQDADPFDLGTLRIESAQAQAVLGNDEITEEEIEKRNASTIADVFAGESSITASGGAPIGQKVFVNGVEESLLSITIDGARQNKSAFHHTGNVLIDPALLKSVEVSAGLAPADQGPNALAGSIAYTTKDASDLLEDGDNRGGMFTLSGGSNGYGFRSTLSLFGRTGGFEYLLSGTKASGSDYKDGDGTTIQGTETELTDYIAKVAYTSDSGRKLSFSASQTTDDGYRAAQAGPGGIFFIRPDFASVVGRPSVLVQGLSERTSYTLTYTDENAEGWFAPTVQLSYNEQELDASGVTGTNKSFSGTFKNKFELANGTVTAGLDFFDETAVGYSRAAAPFNSSGREDHTNFGLFAQARQDLSERVSVSYGARYDWQTFDAADGGKYSANGASANGSIDFMLNDNWTLNAGLASSWGGYELGEAALINFGTAWDYTGFTTSRATAARIGVRYAKGPWDVKAALFDTRVDDINAVLPTAGARGAVANLKSRGFDGSLGYTFDKGFVRANYTYADVEIDGAAAGSTAYYLGRPVGHVIGLEGGYTFNSEWTVGGNAQVALKNSDTAIELPAYEVINLFAEYKPRQMQNLNVRFDVTNLLDSTFSRRSSDGIDATNVVPLTDPGRMVRLTATIKF